MKTAEKKKPARVPKGLMSLHRRIIGMDEPRPDEDAVLRCLDRVVSACDLSASAMRRAVFKAVEDLRDS